VGECGKQQAQEGRRGPVPAIEKRPGALLNGSGDLPHIRRSASQADDLARKQKGYNERKQAHAQEKVHPILCSHKSSQTKELKRYREGSQTSWTSQNGAE
jgi:hypothetical protein